MVRRDGDARPLLHPNGHDWADRFPAIVDAALRIKAHVVPDRRRGGDRSRRWDVGLPCAAEQARGSEAVLFAFDLIEHDGDDLRDLPLIERKRRLRQADRQGQAGAPSSTSSI